MNNRERAKEILNKVRVDTPLENDDNSFMIELLKEHPNAKEKIGSGIDYIFVSINSYKKRAFFVRRKDGTREVFSYIECTQPKTHHSKVRDAMRTGIMDQTLNFKRAIFARDRLVPCAVTGKMLNYEQADVDHAPPTFAVISDMFLESENLTTANVQLKKNYRDDRVFEDDALAQRWREYHKQHAVLRVVDSRVNRGQR